MAGRSGGTAEPLQEDASQPNTPGLADPRRKVVEEHPSQISAMSGYPGSGGTHGLVPSAHGLDLSFGYTPLQFEKINLIGSQLSEQAISSLVLSVPNITYLDLRGNSLNAAFGWRLVKAMKKRYLQLEWCNGVHMRALRDNAVTSLTLAGFPGCRCGQPNGVCQCGKASSCPGHIGMFGIEVVGAIFLAHFLRLNSSLTFIDFRRNDVQKDGAKALAQSLLGNPQCALRTVNTMGQSIAPGPGRGGKPGIDFAGFRASTLTHVNLSKRGLDDDDFVFLEEWLRRYDCVTDLDISHNLIHRDGLRKLTRHVKDTKTLRKLNCYGLPVDLEGTALLARAVVDNNTLEHVVLSLGPCDDNPERQQMLQQLAVGMARHPTLHTFGLSNIKLWEIRENKLREFASDRMVSNWNRADSAVYMWFIAAMKPSIEKLRFGSGGKPTKEYPNLGGSPPELWPPLIGCIYDLHHTLKEVNVTMPKGYGPLAMEFMRALMRCSVLEKLHIMGYASAVLRDSALPQDWTALGVAPRWLVDDRAKKIKVHWQALYGLINALPHLQSFNDISLEGGLRDQPDRTVLLLCQCLEGVAAEFVDSGGETVMNASLQKTADVGAFCDVLRILSRTPLVIKLNFSDKNMEVVKSQQAQLASPLSGVPAGDGGPRFTHAVELRNNVVSGDLLQTIDCNAPLREFCFESVGQVLAPLFTALCGREKVLPVKKMRIEPKWMKEELKTGTKKRFTEKQRQKLDAIQAALIRSDAFQEIDSTIAGTHDRQSIEGMAPEQFAMLMSGLQAEEPKEFETFQPHTHWRYYPSYRAFVEPDEEAEELYVPLPLNEEGRDLQLQKLSLCMCNIRPHLTRTARPDEWPASSRPLWAGPRRFVRVGDWNEYEPLPPEEERENEEEEEDNTAARYHWRAHLKIGAKQPLQILADDPQYANQSFVDGLISDILRGFFQDNQSLTWLDVRGNGLTKEDADLLLELCEQEEQIIRHINMIPLLKDDAANMKKLVLDGTCLDKVVGVKEDEHDDDPFGDGGEEATGEAYARESLEADFVRLDVGDGYIFLHLVQPTYFPDLEVVVLRRHEIPDETLPHITDALLSLPSISQLQLSDLRLSSRGASLLLSAVAEMAPRLISLNGLPLARLMQLRNGNDQNPMELGKVEWNDFSLGAMSRLNLWPIATFPPDSDGSGQDFQLGGKSLTDVGLRGLCAMLRHFASQERSAGPGSAPRSTGVYLTAINLAGNAQITDVTVADLCHTMQHPTMGSALRHSLRDINLRSCPRLKTRSAFELLSLVHHVRDVIRDSSNGSAFGSSLEKLNGVDLHTLQATMRQTSSGGRVTAPPMLLRSFVELGKKKKANCPLLSECDMQFFAGVLHLYPQIPYCHVHVVIPGRKDETDFGELAPWGRDDFPDGGSPFAEEKHISNDSPFPAPIQMSGSAIKEVQSHIDAARRLFESSPILNTQLRVSVCPVVSSCQDIIEEGDSLTLVKLSASDKSTAASSSFGRCQQRMQDQSTRRRKKRGEEVGPRRPLYVNNINSQQLHDCFRTLYGQDDLDVVHTDVIPDEKGNTVSLSTDVDMSQLFGIATSVDLQHLDLGPIHLTNLKSVTEMPVLSHINLNHNHLSDQGIELLFSALVAAGATVVHVAASSNNIGDAGVATIAYSLAQLPRLTSLELCDNFIQEKGSIALAEAVGGHPISGHPDEPEEAAPMGPLPILSVDLRGNRSRELGAMRWAEVVAAHPTLQFLCLAHNELGRLSADSFLGLVYAAVASAALSVLDLRDNFPLGPNQPTVGPPSNHVVQELLTDLPPGEFDPAEVKQGVFIRRHRGGGGDRKGRQGGQPGQGGQGSGKR